MFAVLFLWLGLPSALDVLIDPLFESHEGAFLLEVSQLLDQVIPHWDLFKVIQEHWDEQIEKDELAANKQWEKE